MYHSPYESLPGVSSRASRSHLSSIRSSACLVACLEPTAWTVALNSRLAGRYARPLASSFQPLGSSPVMPVYGRPERSKASPSLVVYVILIA